MANRYRTRTAQFSATAKWLHWIVAFLMMSVLPVAIGFSFVAREDRAEAIPVHASIGLIVVALTLVRLAWRAANPPPPLPAGTPQWSHRGAKAGHFLLYALILWQGAIGIWMAAASPVGIRFFNTFNISALAPADPALIEAIRPLHNAGAWALVLMLTAHVAGALWHHFSMRDDVLMRMLPFSGLWYRLTQDDYSRQWRFPSASIGNWPRRLSREGGRL